MTLKLALALALTPTLIVTLGAHPERERGRRCVLGTCLIRGRVGVRVMNKGKGRVRVRIRVRIRVRVRFRVSSPSSNPWARGTPNPDP